MPIRGTLRKGLFDDPLTPEARYWTGFLMADGGIGTGRHQYMVQLRINQRDVGHLKKFADFLGSGNKVHENLVCQFNEKAKPSKACAFGFSSQEIVERLAFFGVVQRKSQKERVHESLALDRDFWRGVVDGDGSIFITDKRGRDYPFIQLCGSVELVQQFIAFIEMLTGARPSMHFARTVPYVVVSSLRAQRVIRALYLNSSVYLDRKFQLAQTCLSWRPRQESRCL